MAGRIIENQDMNADARSCARGAQSDGYNIEHAAIIMRLELVRKRCKMCGANDDCAPAGKGQIYTTVSTRTWFCSTSQMQTRDL